jgi:hypothetical protein
MEMHNKRVYIFDVDDMGEFYAKRTLMSNGATIVMKSPNFRKRSQDIMDYVTFKEEVACLQLQFDTKLKEFVRKYGMEAYSKEVEAATADAKQGRKKATKANKTVKTRELQVIK